MSGKLSGPQRALLADIIPVARVVSTTYEPAKKLVSLGLARWRETRFGASILDPTPAGRAALSGQVPGRTTK